MGYRKGAKQKRKSPFRNMAKDGVTYSFLQKFLLDREQARLSYVEGLIRDGAVDALDFGQCFHTCCEHTAAVGNCDLHALDRAIGNWLAEQKKFRKLTDAEYAHIRFLADQVAMIYPHYYNFWKKRKGHEFRCDFVCQEEDFRVEHQLPGGGSIILRGRWDAVFRIAGKLWLLETKTKSQIDESGLQASLSQDLQTMMYCYAIQQVYGEKPAGVLYNVIRRPGHRMGKNDTEDTVIERMEKDVKADPNKYFLRYEVQFASKDIDKWVERTFNPLLRQVHLWWEEIKVSPFDPWKIPNRIHHFINPEGLYTKFGKSEFFDYLTRGSTHGLRRREDG